jgi:hypothetical protein
MSSNQGVDQSFETGVVADGDPEKEHDIVRSVEVDLNNALIHDRFWETLNAELERTPTVPWYDAFRTRVAEVSGLIQVLHMHKAVTDENWTKSENRLSYLIHTLDILSFSSRAEPLEERRQSPDKEYAEYLLMKLTDAKLVAEGRDPFDEDEETATLEHIKERLEYEEALSIAGERIKFLESEVKRLGNAG